ncbi:effector-associated constant component EACC1 [Streptomyces sp. P6-2-1]|uniref:effector-associated constant component EACC1 n=1 Tax=Streptomyces sp. P6-2-1 TaxID=3422591 RepID=UPI003D36523D
MKIVITVDGGAVDTEDLRQWLGKDPALRGRVRRAADPTPRGGTMGLAADAVLALLAPGGVATVLAGAVIAWLQTRKGSRTITITRPDGTEISVTTAQVETADAGHTERLVQRIAAQLDAAANSGHRGGPAEPDTAGDPETPRQPGASARE